MGDNNVTHLLSPLLGFALAYNIFIVACVFVLAVIIFLKARKGGTELSKAGEELPKVLDSLAYAELPMPVICAMCIYFKIRISDIIKAYDKDSSKRRNLVLDAFNMDPVCGAFLTNYNSKFVNHGYVGEQLIKNLEENLIKKLDK